MTNVEIVARHWTVPVVMTYCEEPDQIPIWNIHYNFNFSLKVRHRGSRSTPGPGPSKSGFGVWKGHPSSLYWGCPATFFLKRFNQNAWLRLKNPTSPPFGPPGLQGQFRAPLDDGVRVLVIKPNQGTIRAIYYNFDLTSYPSVWVFMAPEGHGAQVPPDLDLRSKKVTCPTKFGGPAGPPVCQILSHWQRHTLPFI